LLRSIMETAMADKWVDVNPCQLTGVSTSQRADGVRPVTRAEVEAISAAMPPAYRAFVLMSAVLGMPVSELSELRRKDIDLTAEVVRVRRAVALVNRVFKVTGPMSTEGIRDLALPAPLVPVIEAHLHEYVQPGRESLIFPSVRDPDRHLSTVGAAPNVHKSPGNSWTTRRANN
jgi:integrase